MAGMIGVLAAMSEGVNVVTSVAYSEDVESLLKDKDVPVYRSVKDEVFLNSLNDIDLILSVHCREIVGEGILSRAKCGGINVHPYLYKYKGADPVGRAIKEGEFNASVGVHRMTDIVDGGEVLFEDYLDVTGARTPQEVYAKLYPFYAMSVLKAIRMVENEV